MYQYLRVKKDSVTSILLFIFNVFLVERGIDSIPLKKIFPLLGPFEKNETAIRMGLSRGVQNGLFVNEKHGQEVWYRLTEQALQSFLYWQTTMTRFREKTAKQRAGWDGNWSIAVVDIPPRNKPEVDIEEFARALEQLGWAGLNKGQWISPYDLSRDTMEVGENHHLKNRLFIFRGRLENMAPEKAADRFWPIRELEKKYTGFLENVNVSAQKLKAGKDPGRVLPFLHYSGMELFEIIQDDPQLPLELLPEGWPGEKAARTFWEIREQVLPEANRFIDQILG